MKKVNIISALISAVFLLAGCQDNKPQPDPELLNIELQRGDLILCSGKQFGEVSFSLQCDYSVRETFDLAVSLLHSFEYDEAEKAFVQVIDADPDCAMAYWGVAMSIYHALWAPPTENDMERGAKILKIAESIPKTEREQEYLEAIGMYYQDWEKTDAKTRAKRMADKMEAIYLKYQDDTEAAILYALALNSTADPTDKNYTNQRKAGGILESIFPDQPNHPGIAHYIIHNYDNPVLAENALPTARKYADIAPASAHAQHMPSHIFTRLGLWDESIQTNLNATASAKCYAENAGFEGMWDEELHCIDYLVYAYLQQGDNNKAKELHEYLQTIKTVYPVNFKVYAIAAIPARIALENRDWDTAANLELPAIATPWEQYPWQQAIVHFSKAMGALHLDNTSQTEAEIENLQALHQHLTNAGNQYQANQVQIQINTATAWLHFKNGNNDEALALMREAAEMEDNTTKHPVTPCEVLPARELLGDLLLAMNMPAEALEAYELDLQAHPNRFNGIYGAAMASKQAGEQDKAKLYFENLLNLTASANSNRFEIKAAGEFIGEI